MIRKTYRIDEDTDLKIKELLNVYNLKSENELFKAIVKDIYQIKKSKSLVPIEELSERDRKLQQVIFEAGRLKGTLEEKEKTIEQLKKDKEELIKIVKEQQKPKSFWSRLFGK